jgi:hypothetical protein
MLKHLLAGAFVWLSCAAMPLAAERYPSRLVVRPPLLTLALTGECRASNDTVKLAQAEAARVWSPADVILKWVKPSELPYASAPTDWLVVRCATADAVTESNEPIVPIAAIRFVSGLPTNTIVVDINNANTLLLREARDPRDPRARFAAYRQVSLGRMLGRAIAHEIGHFLSQSGGHTRTGLMRATHTVAALTGASLKPFRVGEPEALSQY